MGVASSSFLGSPLWEQACSSSPAPPPLVLQSHLIIARISGDSLFLSAPYNSLTYPAHSRLAYIAGCRGCAPGIWSFCMTKYCVQRHFPGRWLRSTPSFPLKSGAMFCLCVLALWTPGAEVARLFPSLESGTLSAIHAEAPRRLEHSLFVNQLQFRHSIPRLLEAEAFPRLGPTIVAVHVEAPDRL